MPEVDGSFHPRVQASKVKEKQPTVFRVFGHQDSTTKNGVFDTSVGGQISN